MYHQKKPAKSEQHFTNVLLAHNPHNIPLDKRKWPERIRIISVDPGCTHFSLNISERNIRRDEPIITLLLDKVGLTKEEQEPDKDNVTRIFTFIQDFLDKHRELFLTCHMVLIEKQLPINYRAVRMSQHVLTYFMILLKNKEPELPMFLEVAPTLKGRELGAPSNLNERGLKQWAVVKATELLTIREDKKGLEILNRKIKGKKEKKDDLADTIIMAESVCSQFGWPLTKTLSKPVILTNNKPVTLNIIKPLPEQTKPNLIILQPNTIIRNRD